MHFLRWNIAPNTHDSGRTRNIIFFFFTKSISIPVGRRERASRTSGKGERSLHQMYRHKCSVRCRRNFTLTIGPCACIIKRDPWYRYGICSKCSSSFFFYHRRSCCCPLRFFFLLEFENFTRNVPDCKLILRKCRIVEDLFFNLFKFEYFSCCFGLALGFKKYFRILFLLTSHCWRYFIIYELNLSACNFSKK